MSLTEKARRELLDEFRRGTLERVERINLVWITLERDPHDGQAAEELARQLHTLKGESKMMGFVEASLLVHRIEEVVLYAKERGFQVGHELGDLLLAATDAIVRIVNKTPETSAGTVDIAELFEPFDALLVKERSEGDTRVESIESKPKTADSDSIQKSDEPGVSIDQFTRVNTQVVSMLTELTSELVIVHSRYAHAVGMLRQVNQQIHQALGRFESTTDMIQTAASGSDLSKDAMSDNRRNEGAAVYTLQNAHERLVNIIKFLEQQVHEGCTRAEEAEYNARQLRLIPVETLFNKYIRVVRDLAAEQGKLVAVEIEGTGVSLDKNVAQKIAEPLLHLVRNSVDHGLEIPEERLSAGKAENGTITLSAVQEGESIAIAVADDGRGVDLDSVKRLARANRIIFGQEAESLNQEALIGLLFRPGFTTRETATETSGRGVGLDVVKREVELLGGVVRVFTTTGSGTRFELRVPISIALTRVLMIRAGRRLFAIPSAAVLGVMAIDESAIEMVHNRRSIRFRGEAVALASLASAVGDADETARFSRAVVIRQDDKRIALLVSEWRDEIDAIVKPLGELFAHTRLFTSACLSQDGDLALVLNPAELLFQTLVRAPRVRLAPEIDDSAEGAKRILLVEDSTITRAMLARVLDALGYQVFEAENGAAALKLLETESIDIVLTDIEMPRMDGIELITHVRKEPKWRNLPIVVLSTLGSIEDKKRGVDAGADAYLVKTEFSEQTLSNVISTHLAKT